MASKHTGLTVTVSADSVDYSARGKAAALNSSDTTQDTHGFGDTYGAEQILGRDNRFTLSLDDVVSSRKASEFDISVLTLDGSSLIGLARSITMNVAPQVQDSGGLKDFHGWAQVTGARMISGNISILTLASAASSAWLLAAQSSDPTDNEVVLSINTGFGGGPITVPVTLGAIGHTFNRDGLQEVTVGYKGNGAPTAAPNTGILGAVFGDCLLDMLIETGMGSYTRTGVIETYSLEVAHRQITKQDLTVFTQGDPGYAATA